MTSLETPVSPAILLCVRRTDSTFHVPLAWACEEKASSHVHSLCVRCARGCYHSRHRSVQLSFCAYGVLTYRFMFPWLGRARKFSPRTFARPAFIVSRPGCLLPLRPCCLPPSSLFFHFPSHALASWKEGLSLSMLALCLLVAVVVTIARQSMLLRSSYPHNKHCPVRWLLRFELRA
jgi:hypothetical protein